jgi:hypothetical protein
MARCVDATAAGAGPREDARRPGKHQAERVHDVAGRPSRRVRRLGYSPLKRGSRFSTNAIIASAVSLDENISACATSSNSIASAIV